MCATDNDLLLILISRTFENKILMV